MTDMLDQPTVTEDEIAADARHRRAAPLTRRSFLQTAGASGLLAAGGYGIDSLATSAHAPSVPVGPRFRSRSDFNPPPISVVVPAMGTAPGLVMLTPGRSSEYQHGPMILDGHGRLVWFAPQMGGSTNLKVQTYEGRPVLTWWEGELVEPAGYGRGNYVIAGPDYEPITRVRGVNGLQGDLHEFVITSRGTALFTAYREIGRDLSSVGGRVDGKLLDSLLQEVDIRTGRLIFQWSAADHVDLPESYVTPPPSPSEPFDFFHMNSIDVDADGNLLISARHTSAVYKLDRLTGKVIWRLGGKRSDFRIEKRARFWYQHHAVRHPDGLLTLFDDGAGTRQVEASSRGLKLEVDERTMSVSLRKQYLPEPPLLATSQGSMQLLPNGDVFIGWGSQPYFSEFSRDGRLRFDARIASPSISYRAFRFPWTGTPTGPPSIAAERSVRDVTVYASWNGATEVARWDILTGASATDLHPIGSFRRTGFETKMQVASTRGFVAVQARDGVGVALGRSSPVRV
jgi:hypothetical protein